ncbi:ABC transporter permease [Carnobacteriaceae bacterium zg-ZUI240]|nr:ABC transporter permease [Carnobacteriaceae bacterium zg-ZUI240]
MDKLYKQRLQAALLQKYRYLRYILNDHVLVIVFFLFVTLAYAYHDFLQQSFMLPQWVLTVFVSGFITLLIYPIRVATLLKKQDLHYLNHSALLTKRYFYSAQLYSVLFVLFAFVSGTIILLPLLHKVKMTVTLEWWLNGVLYSFIHVMSQLTPLKKQLSIVLFIVMVSYFYIGVFSCVILCCLFVFVYTKQSPLQSIAQLIEAESYRLMRQNMWLHFFGDAPIHHNTKKQSYFDNVVSRVNVSVLVKYALRQKEIRENVVGQMIVASLVIFASKNVWVISAVVGLLLFLSGVQLYHTLIYQCSRFYKWMPHNVSDWKKEMKHVVFFIFLLQSGMIVVLSSISIGVISVMSVVLSIFIVRFLVLPLYIFSKIDKMM